MLDVHPAHHAASTWRDFFIHIATIVLGLLIAIGLEQAVEYVHHRHLAREAVATLEHEFEVNAGITRDNLRNMTLREQQHRADLAVIHHVRNHTLAPAEGLYFTHAYSPFSDAAWTTVHESGATLYIPYDVLSRYAALYKRQANIDIGYTIMNLAVQNATSVLNGEDPDPSRGTEDRVDAYNTETEPPTAAHDALLNLTPAQLDRLELGYQQAIEDDRRLKRLYTRLDRINQAFGKPDE